MADEKTQQNQSAKQPIKLHTYIHNYSYKLLTRNNKNFKDIMTTIFFKYQWPPQDSSPHFAPPSFQLINSTQTTAGDIVSCHDNQVDTANITMKPSLAN
jgi:hypothetical protein